MKQVDRVTYERTKNTVKLALCALIALAVGLVLASLTGKCRCAR